MHEVLSRGCEIAIHSWIESGHWTFWLRRADSIKLPLPQEHCCPWTTCDLIEGLYRD
jgi:hypothetical protein